MSVKTEPAHDGHEVHAGEKARWDEFLQSDHGTKGHETEVEEGRGGGGKALIAKADYVTKNPKTTGCKTSFDGGMTLNEWDIEDDAFYEYEGKQIGTRNLWASIPNLLMGFAVWLMWSVVIGKIQKAHTADPSVYYFKDMAPEYLGVSEGFRGCPGWYDDKCCTTWQKATQADFDAWQAGASLSKKYANADDFMYSTEFKKLKVNKDDNAAGFTGTTKYGCKVSDTRKKDYKATTYVISATAGLSGGIFRLPNSFVVPLVGGRNVKYFTSILLAIPCMWMALVLGNPDVNCLTVVFCAMFSGVGGGAFASSMANINPFFPKRRAGYALGMNGGLGNLGVSLCQLFLGNVMMVYAIGDAKGIAGTYIPQGGWFLFPMCLASALAAFLWMNNMPQKVHPVPTDFFQMLGRYCSLQLPGYVASLVGVCILYYTTSVKGAEAIALSFGIIVAVCIVEHLFIWYLSTPAAKPKLQMQIAIFKDKHTYWMTYLYIMTFGSFIGFSNAFPKLIIDLFDEYGPVECAELQAKGVLAVGDCSYTKWPVTGFSPAFLGALIGSLIRPIGGVFADKFGGARVTHYHTLLMTIITVILGIIVSAARNADSNRASYFPPFLICFLILFYCTGVGNGSTFRQIAVIFSKELSPPVLGWSSAIASFGAFLIPKFFAIAIQAGVPEAPFFVLAVYYFTCLFVNYWFYFRTGAEKPC